MPNIRMNDAAPDAAGPVRGYQARPWDTGEAGNALSRVGSAVSDVGEVIQRRDAQAEISDTTAKLSQLQLSQTQGLQQALSTADPSDRNIADKFLNQYDEAAAKIGDNLSTPQAQEYFQKANAQLRAHFMAKAMGGQAQLAGIKTQQDYGTSLNGWSSGLVSDPSQFETTYNLHNQYLQNLQQHGMLDPVSAAKLQKAGDTQLATSAVRGWIGLNPEIAQKQLNSGQWDQYLNGDQKYKMLQEAQQGIRAKQTEQDRVQALQKKADEAQQNAIQSNFLSRLNDPQNPLSTKDVLNSKLKAFGSGSKEEFLQIIKKQSTQEIKTDPHVYTSVWDRIHLPDGDPNKITDPNQMNSLVGRGLTLHDVQAFRNEMDGTKTPEGQIESQLKKNFVSTVKNELTKSNSMLGLHDPQGDEQFQRFLATFLPAYDQARKSGKSATDLLDPKSPDYMGKMAQTFYRSPDQIMQSLNHQNVPAGSLAPSSTTAATQGVPSPTPSASSTPSGAGRQGAAISPPPGLNFQQWQAWMKAHPGS